MRHALLSLCFAAAVVSGGGHAARAAESGINVSDAWMRVIIAKRPAAGYMTIRNDGDKPRHLIEASSPSCGMLMLHKTVEQGGQSQMIMLNEVVVPAHGSVAFKSGSFHLMCMGLGSSMKPGNTVSVTLGFADGAKIEVPFLVKNATGK